MKINDKKGVSTIVTVVLLVLVAIAAVALIAAFIVPFIKGSLSESQECFAVLGKVDVVSGSNTCFNATSNEVSVRIKRGFASDVKVDSIAVVLAGSGMSKRFDITTGASSSNVRALSGAYNTALALPAEGEENTYVFNVSGSGMAVASVEVSPVLASDKVCEATTAEIPACA